MCARSAREGTRETPCNKGPESPTPGPTPHKLDLTQYTPGVEGPRRRIPDPALRQPPRSSRGRGPPRSASGPERQRAATVFRASPVSVAPSCRCRSMSDICRSFTGDGEGASCRRKAKRATSAGPRCAGADSCCTALVSQRGERRWSGGLLRPSLTTCERRDTGTSAAVLTVPSPPRRPQRRARLRP